MNSTGGKLEPVIALPAMDIQILPPHVDYAERFYQWRNEAITLKFNPIRTKSLATLREDLQKSPGRLHPLDHSVAHRWFIGFKGEIVGTVSLSEINSMMGIAEVGYMIGEAYHGLGIATAALKLWTSMIFELTNLRKLTASVAESHSASLRVLEKAGYQREGLLREHYLVQNRPTNEVVFGILRREWACI